MLTGYGVRTWELILCLAPFVVFFGSTVLTSLFYVTREFYRFLYTEGEPVFFRSFGLFHFQVQKGIETITLK